MATTQQMMADYLRRMRLDPTAPPVTMESQVNAAVNAPMTPGTGGFGAPPVPTDLKRQAMAARTQDFTDRQSAVDSQRAIAQQMRSGKSPEGRTVGPYDVYVAPNWGEVAGDVATKLGGGYLEGRANKEGAKIDEARSNAALEKALEEKARFEAQEAREDTKLDLLVDAAEPEQQYKEFTNGKSTIRGYTVNGVGYDENGNRLPEGFSEKYAPKGSGLGGRNYITKITDNSGNELITRLDPYDPESVPEFLMIGENGENSWTQDKAAASASIRSTVEADAATEKETGVSGVRSNQARIDVLNEEIPNQQKELALYFEAIEAVASGANTGPFAGRMPSFSEASVWLDNVQQELGLAKIAKYTFGSLSEAEGQWVRESSIPQNLNEEFLSDFLRRKAEGARRMLKARQFERAYREEFRKRPKDAMVDKILYEGGFTYGVPDEWLEKEE